jgi:hypothetical protein
MIRSRLNSFEGNFLRGAVVLLGIATCVAATRSIQCQTVNVNFDDGTIGSAIGDFYGCSGVQFSNVVWASNSDIGGMPYAGASSGPCVISGQTSGSFPTSSSALIARFDAPVTDVSIVATDVGSAGAEIDAYDQTEGGNVVASDQFIGQGLGIQTYHVLTVHAASIRRVEWYQPAPNGGDGIVWDNLTFGPSSVPLSLSLTRIDGQTHIHLIGLIGSTYILQIADALPPDPDWVDLTTSSPSHDCFVDFVDSTNATRRFYRAKAQ